MASDGGTANAIEPTSVMAPTQTQDAMTAPSSTPATSAGPSQALDPTDTSLSAQDANPTQAPLPSAANAPADETATGEGDADDEDSDCSFQDSDYDSDGFSVDDVEKEIERKNRIVMFDKDGLLLWKHIESSYGDKYLRRREEHSLAFMYDISSAIELRRFVRDRGLQDPYPQGVTLKYFYLQVLDQADMNGSFRFLGLPPEMRNGIYRELLTVKDDVCQCGDCAKLLAPCYTAILRTSKKIYNEAKNVLYGENTINCIFAVCTDGEEIHQRYTQIHNKEAEGYQTEINNVFWGMDVIPDWFRRIQSLRIDISAHGLGLMGSARGFLQGCTLNLASFLLDGHSPKKLEVKFTDHLHLHEESNLVEAVLYPFGRLSGLNHVSITGDVDVDLSQRLAAEIQRAREPVLNTMPYQHFLRSEALAYLHMVGQLNPWSNPDQLVNRQDIALSDLIKELLDETQYSYDSDEEDVGLFHNSETEDALNSVLGDLEDFLDMGARSKKRRVSKSGKARFVKVRALRKAYASKDWANGADGPTYEFNTLKL